MPDWEWYLLLIPAGFIAGVVNTIAGGGSFLTLPALIFVCGLDPLVANGTNRIAILFSSGAASLTFKRRGHLDMDVARSLLIPTVCGVPFGSLLAVYLPTEAFRPIFGLIFLAMAVILIIDPKRLTASNEKPAAKPTSSVFLVFFAIGLYVGFIQAGMGILLLLGMSLIRRGDLVASNAVKNLIGFVVTLAATCVFAFYGKIDWLPGLVTAAGNILGGLVGAKLAIKKGNKLIFGFLVVVMLATGAKLIWPTISSLAQSF